MSFNYNLLNLLREVYYWPGANAKIKYYYTFDGEKLRKTVENNGIVTKVDYCGPFVYETASGVRSLKYIVTPDGRAVKNGSSWDYEYNLTDHLGNVRAVIRKGSNGLAELIQQKHYYPFGMEMSQLNLGTGTNKYLYNSKEIQNDFDLYWYDYGARFYDPQLGRWHSVDPMAEKYYSISPYAYVANNPLRFIDPDGRKIVDANGNIIYTHSGGWSKNAPADAVRLGKAMMGTRTGASQFNKMAGASYPIELKISSANLGGKLGNSFIRRSVSLDKNGQVVDVKIKSVKVEIYEGSIKNILENNIRGADAESQDLINAYRMSTNTIDQAIGAVAGHEAVHTTDSQNQRESAENDYEGTIHDIEKEPRKVERQILRESFDQNLKEIEPIMPF
jgi:RHS repeat-associated protein